MTWFQSCAVLDTHVMNHIFHGDINLSDNQSRLTVFWFVFSLFFNFARSRSFNDFIAKCLVKDPEQRPSATELLQVCVCVCVCVCVVMNKVDRLRSLQEKEQNMPPPLHKHKKQTSKNQNLWPSVTCNVHFLNSGKFYPPTAGLTICLCRSTLCPHSNMFVMKPH